MSNENKVLSEEQRKALGLENQETTKRGPGRPKKTIVEDQLSEVEIAKQAMFASFGTEGPESANISSGPSPTVEIDLEELLSNLTIDVNKVEIVDKPNINALSDSSIIINGRPTFEIVCNQSGYIAYMQSLKYSDLSSLENSTGGFYAGRQRLYKTIYDKLNTTSVGKVDFKTFLQMTSLYDVPSLMYAIYCQSFKTEVEFTVKCPHCEEEMNIKVHNKGLLLIRNEEVYNNIENIMASYSTPQEAIEKSLVSNRIKVVLPNSKMIVEVKIPTLYKYLEIIGSVKPEKFEELQDILGMMVFIDKVYKLDIANLVKNKKVSYYEIINKDEIAKTVANLELEDSTEIQKIIAKETEKYAIEYAIKGMTCRHCKKDIGNIPVDMEELTFFRLRQM